LLISDYLGGGCKEIGIHNFDSDFYPAPTSHRLWRAPEADLPPSYFWHRRLTTIAQKTNYTTRLIALAEESCNNLEVSTITEIQEAIDKLPAKERTALAAWLRSQDQPRMSEREEAALLASLDKAATELDAGRGVPVERVREMVGRWLTK
jgi:hypothetical protein